MNRKSSVLLKALLLSTSRINKIKYVKDKKIRKKTRAGIIGVAVLYAMLMFYSIMMCVGYGVLGLAYAIPGILSVTISILAFVFTIFKTNGYLFNFKEYDMLMSLPFEPRTIAMNKFLYMYIASLPWYLSISLAMMVGYGVFERPSILVYIVWIVLTLVLPFIPMVLASFIGFLIAKVSAGSKLKNVVQAVLTFVFVIFCFSLQYIIEALAKSDEKTDILAGFSEKIDQAGRIYFPIGWFDGAIRELCISDMLLLIAASILAFVLVFAIVGKNYRQINSAFKTHATSKSYEMKAQKKNSVVQAIAFKEYKRLVGTHAYLVNIAMGEVLVSVLSILTLVLGMDRIIHVVLKGAPVSSEMIYPAIPLIIYFFLGMVATTTCSPSLEGKNYWIMQSLPIEKKTMYKGKMLFNMYLTVPFAILGTLCLSISAKAPLLNILIYLVEVIVLCGFSTAWGCVCGVKHMRLDWENEIEVVKQGAAVAIYMFPNMFVCMGLMVLVVFLGTRMNSNIISLAVTAIAALLAALSYLRVMALAKRG